METFPCPQAFVCIAKENRHGEDCTLFAHIDCSPDFPAGIFVGKMLGSSRFAVNAAKGMGAYERTNDLVARTDRPSYRRLYGGAHVRHRVRGADLRTVCVGGGIV